MIKISRYHDISCGHRVFGHESKCRGLHGHNYRITFEAAAPALDQLGRVIDFGVLKSELCEWLEDTWDHKTLIWVQDPFWTYASSQVEHIKPFRIDPGFKPEEQAEASEVVDALSSIISVPFNPTAENMALHLLHVIGPALLSKHDISLTRVTVEETRKCSAIAEL